MVFVQADTLNLHVGVLPMKVHPAPCCGHHCFYMRCCRVFSGLSGSHHVPIAGSDGDQFLLTLSTCRILLRIYTRSSDRNVFDCDW